MIRLSRESMEAIFRKYLETVFEHPEIISAGVRNIAIARENMEDAGKQNVPDDLQRRHAI